MLKFIKVAKAQFAHKTPSAYVDAVASTLPDAKDIPLDLALEAMTTHGIMIKNISQTTSYSYGGLEFDLSMSILVTPNSGKETLGQLNAWFFQKAFKKW